MEPKTQCATFDVVWLKQIGDGYHLQSLEYRTSNLRWMHHMPISQLGIFEQWVNYGKVITPTTWQPTLFILWGERNGAWFSIQNKELEGWSFIRLSLEVTFCGLTILTVPHPSHILLTSLSNTETLPRKIRPQMESERWHSARQKHVIASESYPVEAKGNLCHLLPFLCHCRAWSSPGSQGWESKALLWGKWLSKYNAFFNWAMGFTEWKETSLWKQACL